MINKKISTTEARKDLARITDEVAQKKATYTLTKHGQVVAVIAPSDYLTPTISPKLAQEFEAVLRDYGPALKELAQR